MLEEEFEVKYIVSACGGVDSTIRSFNPSRIQNPTTIIEAPENTLAITPNPVSDIITITFEQHNVSNVKIELCDITGNCITTLYEGILNAGTYTNDYNLAKLGIATGSYIIKITDNNHTFSKQFIFAK